MKYDEESAYTLCVDTEGYQLIKTKLEFGLPRDWKIYNG